MKFVSLGYAWNRGIIRKSMLKSMQKSAKSVQTSRSSFSKYCTKKSSIWGFSNSHRKYRNRNCKNHKQVKNWSLTNHIQPTSLFLLKYQQKRLKKIIIKSTRLKTQTWSTEIIPRKVTCSIYTKSLFCWKTLVCGVFTVRGLAYNLDVSNDRRLYNKMCVSAI